VTGDVRPLCLQGDFMLEWLATSILYTPNGLALEASDAWSRPYVEPVKGDRIALSRGELASAVAGVKAEVRLVPWMLNIARASTTVSLRNPGKTWLRSVRVDVEAQDRAKRFRPLYTTFLFAAVKPMETVSLTNDRLWVRVPAGQIAQVVFKAKAQVVGAFRLQPPAKPKAP
jgi:hypothetical protein